MTRAQAFEQQDGALPPASYWPDAASAEVFSVYVAAVERQQPGGRLPATLLEAMLANLGQPQPAAHTYVTDGFGSPRLGLRLNHYPPVSSAEAGAGAGRLLGHEDVTMFTLLPAPHHPGLQVMYYFFPFALNPCGADVFRAPSGSK
jgi:isopenicillin N synthase-like dioxygenase